MDNVMIRVQDLTKTYRVGKQDFHALDGVGFTIREGERVAIIGSNGAGKSTLLSIISGYAAATSGSVEVNAMVSAILEIGTSVQPELSGRANLVDGGMLYGLTREEIEQKLPEIIEFIDIGDYIDQPVKTYSSGMMARLSFGIISFIQPEILIIDEVLGVGDASFARKSEKRLEELCRDGKVMLIVSHSMRTVCQFAQRCIWLDKGRVVMDGPVQQVTAAYLEAVRKKEEAQLMRDLDMRVAAGGGSGAVRVTRLATLDDSTGEERIIFDIFDDIRIELELEASRAVECPRLLVRVENMKGILMAESWLEQSGLPQKPLAAGEKRRHTLVMRDCRFEQNTYEITCLLYDGQEEAARRVSVFRLYNNKVFAPVVTLYHTPYSIAARPAGQEEPK